MGADLDPSVVRSMMEIGQDCVTCKLTSAKQRNVKLTIGPKAFRFNHHVQVDTMFLDGILVVHDVDESTHFSVARLFINQNTSMIWNSIQQMWPLTYMGPQTTLLCTKTRLTYSNKCEIIR